MSKLIRQVLEWARHALGEAMQHEESNSSLQQELGSRSKVHQHVEVALACSLAVYASVAASLAIAETEIAYLLAT